MLQSFAVRGHPITARQQQLLFAALVAARADGSPRIDRETLRRALGADATPQALTHALKRLRQKFRPGDLELRRTHESLLVPHGTVDTDRFFELVDLTRSTVETRPEHRVRLLEEALGLCPPKLWPTLLDRTDDGQSRLVAFRDRTLAARRSMAIALCEGALRMGNALDAARLEADLAADEEWALTHRDALIVACERWANGQLDAAREMLGDHSVPRNDPLQAEWDRINEAIAARELWTIGATLAPAHIGGPSERDGRAANLLRRAGSRWKGAIRPPSQLFGRTDQQLELHRFFGRIEPGHVGTCVLFGAAQSGATAMLHSAETWLSAQGVRTALVACLPRYQRPLGAAIDLLYQLNSPVADSLATESADRAQHAAQLARAIASETGHTPVALLIDDMQHIDPASIGVLEMVRVMRTGANALAVIGAAHLDDPQAADEATQHLRSITSTHAAWSITLEPLSDGDVSALCKDMLGLPLDAASCWAIHEASGGNAGAAVRLITQLHQAHGFLLDDTTLFVAEHGIERSIASTDFAGGRGRSAAGAARRGDASDDPESRIVAACSLLGGGADVDDITTLSELDVGTVTATLKSLGADIEFSPTTGRLHVTLPGGISGASAAGATRADKLRAIRLLCDAATAPDAGSHRHHRPIARLCLELHGDTIPLADPTINVEKLRTQLALAAQDFDRSKTWILAARTWDCIIGNHSSTVLQEQAAVQAGRCWMLAHDATKALARLGLARESTDPLVRLEATEFLCRTIASLETFGHGDRVIELADESVDESRSDQALRAAAARIQCVAAEWLAVCRRYLEARARVASARALIGDVRSRDFAYLELSAGIVELLAAQPAAAHGYFMNAQAHCEGDQWILSSAAARALMCLAEFAHDDVTQTIVQRAKTIAAGAQSWSDYLLACLAAAHAALMSGDDLWGRLELTEARQLETRASYPLAAEPLRTLWGYAFEGEWIDDPSYMSSPIAQMWARSHRPDAQFGPDDLAELRSTAARLIADESTTGLDIWNAAQSSVCLSLAARFDHDLLHDLDPLAIALSERVHTSVLGVVAAIPLRHANQGPAKSA